MSANQKTIEVAVANLEKLHGKLCVQQLGKNKAVVVTGLDKQAKG